MFFKYLTNNSCSFWKSHCLCTLGTLGSVWNWDAYLGDVLELHFHLIVCLIAAVLNTVNYLAQPPMITPEWTTLLPVSSSMHTFCHWWWHNAAGSVSSGARHQCGDNLTKPSQEMSITWQGESLTGLPLDRDIFLPFDSQDTLEILGVFVHFLKISFLRTAVILFLSAQLSPSGMLIYRQAAPVLATVLQAGWWGCWRYWT